MLLFGELLFFWELPEAASNNFFGGFGNVFVTHAAGAIFKRGSRDCLANKMDTPAPSLYMNSEEIAQCK